MKRQERLNDGEIISVRVEDGTKEKLIRKAAAETARTGEQVFISDVARKAVEKYLLAGK